MAATKSVKLMLIAAMALIVICSSLAESASVQHHHHHLNHQRLARSSVPAKDKEVSECNDNTPCGWAVYTRFTRVVDYFMKNTCTCRMGTECIRVDDDVSVSAFVYKCRQVPTTNSKGGGS